MADYVVEKSIEVDAPLGDVWDEMMDVSEWAEWKPFLEYARVSGAYDSLSNGSTLKMGMMFGGPVSLPIKVQVTRFDIHQGLTWAGGVPGLIHAVHSFDFKESGGKTVVTSRETLSGRLLWVLDLLAPREQFEELHEKWLKAIKDRMEAEDEAPAEDHAHGHH